MHDIDRTLLELGGESEAEYEGDVSEFSDQEAEDEDEDEFEDHHEEPELEDEADFGELSESEEVALASELVGLSTEEELDFFLAKVIKNASRKLGKYMNSPTGRTLGGILKGVARKGLPSVANVFAPGVGGGLMAMATDAFGLELEGGEDQEWEAAKSYVRFADTSARNAARAPASAPPRAVARKAIVEAARQHAPGLVRRRHHGGGGAPIVSQDSGRWIRRGRNIVLLGV